MVLKRSSAGMFNISVLRKWGFSKVCHHHCVNRQVQMSYNKAVKWSFVWQKQNVLRTLPISSSLSAGIPLSCDRQYSCISHSKSGTTLYGHSKCHSFLPLKVVHFNIVRQYCMNCWSKTIKSYSLNTLTFPFTSAIRRNFAIEKTGTAETSGMTISTKKRTTRKKTQEKEMIADHKNVSAYAAGDELFMDQLERGLKEQDLYEIVTLPVDITDTLLATAKYKVNGKAREIYFFQEGSVVCWNMATSEGLEVVKLAQRYCEKPNQLQAVLDESEIMNVVTDSVAQLKGSTVHIKGEVPDKPELRETIILEKFAFSNAMAQSVNLAIKEANLDAFVESIEPKTEELQDGKDVKITRRDLNRKLGEIFLLRHDINLRSDLLDTPDVYWEREELETLYRSMCTYLNIPKRTKVMNEKLNYCTHILELFSNQMNDTRHVRLEWLIIVLILIEVVFEFAHYYERYVEKQAEEQAYQVETTIQRIPEKAS